MNKTSLCVASTILGFGMAFAPVSVANAAASDSTTAIIPRGEFRENPTVKVRGITKEAPVTVDWGDGNVSILRTKCTPREVVATPGKCQGEVTALYPRPGKYTIKVYAGQKKIGSETINLPADSTAWSEPKGWSRPTNWAPVYGGATFLPCSTVKWHWDANGQPATAGRMKQTATEALAKASAATGLNFIETANKNDAQLTFDWDWPEGDMSAVAGHGGGYWNRQRAEVSFNPSNQWTNDRVAGWGIKNWAEGQYTYASAGNGSLILHELGHALGLNHVDDPTQLMHPANQNIDLGPGDLEGLRTMYLSRPCPS